MNTASGRFDVPLMATVANCVLSPSSARKTVANVERSRVRFMEREKCSGGSTGELIQMGLVMISDCSA